MSKYQKNIYLRIICLEFWSLRFMNVVINKNNKSDKQIE